MKIALCHGTFDLLHPGHMAVFDYARYIADRIVVSITADDFIEKGDDRPIMNQWERGVMVRACRDVDEVEITYSTDALEVIRKFKPHFFVKGGDYETQDKLGNLETERKAVESYGGRVVFVPHTGHSTTKIIERIRGIV